jgi:hypothetical protein
MKFSRNKLVLSMALLGLTSMVSVNVYAAGKPSDSTTTTSTASACSKAAGYNTNDCGTMGNTASDSVTIAFTAAQDDKESAYEIEFISNSNNTWTYKVTGVKGRDLSHWSIGIENCAGHVTGSPGSDGNVKVDGSTPFVGLKWNTQGGTFSFTLDDNYEAGPLMAMAKTSSVYKTGAVMGPDCSKPVTSSSTPATSGSGSTTTTGNDSTTTTTGDDSTTTTGNDSTTTTGNDTTTTPATCASATNANAPSTATVSWDDSKGTNAYGIQFVGVEGNTWTYQVDKMSGKGLSHWALGFGSCADRVIDTSSSDGSTAEIGKDGSIKDRDFSGIKWNSEGGTFSFTLDGDYPANAVEVLAKAGSLQDGGYSTSTVMGPDCSCNSGPELVLTGMAGPGDICSYFESGSATKAGDVAIPGTVHASYTDNSDASGITVTVSSGNADTSVICAGGQMSGSCDFVTDAGGNVDFDMVASWPGIKELSGSNITSIIDGRSIKESEVAIEADIADYIKTVPSLEKNYVFSAQAAGAETISVEKSLSWNPAMMSSVDVMVGKPARIEMTDGCILTLSNERNTREGGK